MRKLGKLGLIFRKLFVVLLILGNISKIQLMELRKYYKRLLIKPMPKVLILGNSSKYFQSKQFIICSLISKSIELLISTMDSRLEACFVQLTKVQWDEF